LLSCPRLLSTATFFFSIFFLLKKCFRGAQRSKKPNAHFMYTPHITCYQSAATAQSCFTFYILSKGNNAGQPNLTPWVNSFAVHCPNSEALDFYFWLCYSLWQTGRFKSFLRGSVIPFITIHESRQLINQVAESIFPHWQSLQNVIEALNKLKTARAHLAQCIIANEKLQHMLLRIHF
jgi:hypothetical protein